MRWKNLNLEKLKWPIICDGWSIFTRVILRLCGIIDTSMWTCVTIFFSFALYIGASWEGLLHWWAHKRALQWLCPWRLYCRYVSSREVFIRFAYSWACRKGFILSCDKLCTYNVNFRRRVFSGIDSAEILINCAQKKMCKYHVPGKYDDLVRPNQRCSIIILRRPTMQHVNCVSLSIYVYHD